MAVSGPDETSIPPAARAGAARPAATVVIPARFGSTRFPGKILAAETGRPLVQHVVERVGACSRVRQILVATDDARIADALRPFGTNCVMTSPAHPSGTDRIAEVARGLGDDIVVNVQGDEPEIEAEIVDGLIARLQDSRDDMATAATPFPAGADVLDPNLVKVVVGLDGRAIYFSRCPIPFLREQSAAAGAAYHSKTESTSDPTPGPPPGPTYLLHLGIYAYRRRFLLDFASWPPTPLESAEKLEQLRALEHGRSIFVLKTPRATHGIDTPQQYAAFVERTVGRRQSAEGRGEEET